VLGTVVSICDASKLCHKVAAVLGVLASAARVRSNSALSGMGTEQLTKPKRTLRGAQFGLSQSATRAISSFSETMWKYQSYVPKCSMYLNIFFIKVKLKSFKFIIAPFKLNFLSFFFETVTLQGQMKEGKYLSAQKEFYIFTK